MLRRFFCSSLMTLVTASMVCGAEPADFGKVVQPFLKQYCVDCHAGDDAEAELQLDAVKQDFVLDETANQWQQILQTLQFDEMPPPEEDRPNGIAKANVIAWIEQQMELTGRDETYRTKLLNPIYGNYVSHELLFSGEIKTPPFSPSRLWRFSPEIFKGKGIRGAQSPFSHITRNTGVRDYAALGTVDQATVQMILINSNQMLHLRNEAGDFKLYAEDQPVPTDAQLKETIYREFRRAIGREPQEDEKAKYLAFLKKNMADGGSLEGLKTTITAMYLSSESIYRMELGLGEEDKHGRRRLSTEELSYALAYALTDHGPERNQTLWNATKKDQLKTKDEVAAVVRQMLDQGMGPKKLPRIMRFFEEFFGYNRADAVFKDMTRVNNEDIRQWNTNRLMYEAQQIIEYQLERDQNVIEELLTSNRFFIAHPGDNQAAKAFYEEVIRPDYVEIKVQEKLDQFAQQKRDPKAKREKEELDRIRRNAEDRTKRVKEAIEDGLTPFPGWPYSREIRGQSDLIYIGIYNLPATHRTQRQKWNWVMEQPMEMPKEQRAGLLTHPAWLAAHSLNDGNDPVRRGQWIQEKLLAGVIQDVPPDVDANVPNDPHKTLRERLEPLRAERCWRCHRKMNPLGEPFEVFDDWGRYRTEVYFDEQGEIFHQRGDHFDRLLADGKLTARKIDATGEIYGSGDPSVDGKVDNAIEMIHRLGKSDRARQSMIRHLFRYFMGRNEMLSDSQTLIAADQAYLENGGSFKALVVSLLSSDSFLYRR